MPTSCSKASLLLAVKGDGAVHGVGGMVWEGGPSCTVFHVGTSTLINLPPHSFEATIDSKLRTNPIASRLP